MMKMARLGDEYLSHTEPWKLIKTDEERVKIDPRIEPGATCPKVRFSQVLSSAISGSVFSSYFSIAIVKLYVAILRMTRYKQLRHYFVY